MKAQDMHNIERIYETQIEAGYKVINLNVISFEELLAQAKKSPLDDQLAKSDVELLIGYYNDGKEKSQSHQVSVLNINDLVLHLDLTGYGFNKEKATKELVIEIDEYILQLHTAIHKLQALKANIDQQVPMDCFGKQIRVEKGDN